MRMIGNMSVAEATREIADNGAADLEEEPRLPAAEAATFEPESATLVRRVDELSAKADHLAELIDRLATRRAWKP